MRDADWGVGPDVVAIDECVPGEIHQVSWGT